MIGVRMLKLATPNGDKDVPISIEAPSGSGRDWHCSYEIGWPSGAHRKQAGGVDAVQAVCLALQRIGTDLYTSNEHLEGRLRWEKAGDGYGFPVPKNLRGVLVGLDKEFDG